VGVHDTGAKITFALSISAFPAALVWMRKRPLVVILSGAFVALILLVSWIGGEIGSTPWLTALHIPLAMLMMAIAVYLPFTARPRR
jgi:hypothetical protein